MIEENLINILADFLGVDTDDLDYNTNIYNEFNLTEEDICEIICILDDEFEIEINKDDFEDISTIRELSELIEDLI